MTKKANQSLDFRANDFVVYPAHGVGKIMSIEEQEIAGLKLELFVISFEKDNIDFTLKKSDVGKCIVPTMIPDAFDLHGFLFFLRKNDGRNQCDNSKD